MLEPKYLLYCVIIVSRPNFSRGRLHCFQSFLLWKLHVNLLVKLFVVVIEVAV
jgi:hypothetical protein